MRTAFATTRFLRRNSHLGKNSRKARHRWVFRSVTQRTHWGCCNLGYEWRQRRLIGRTVTTYGTGGTTTTQRYVFDGTNMVLAFDVNDNLTDRYLWGPAVDQVLADEHFSYSSGSNQLPGSATPFSTLWALRDNQNTVRDVVTDAGVLEQHIAYSPFGQQVSGLTTTGSVVASFAVGYTGTYTDPVTGLQLHGVRWYNPSSQRWLTQDPLGLRAGMNLYRYCGNAPTIYVDPSGMEDYIIVNGLWRELHVNPVSPTVVFPSSGCVTGDECGPFVRFDITKGDGWYWWGVNHYNNQNFFTRFWSGNGDSYCKSFTPQHPKAISNIVASGSYCCNGNFTGGRGCYGHVSAYVTNLPAGTYDVEYSHHVTMEASGAARATASIEEGNPPKQVLNAGVDGSIPGKTSFDSNFAPGQQRRTVQVIVGNNGDASVFEYDPGIGTPEGATKCDRSSVKGVFEIIEIKKVN